MKLSLKNKLAYSSASIGDAAAYSIVGTFLMFFLTTAAHVSPAAAGTIMAIGSVWDVVFSLIIGFWSDRCTSRLGRRRPFLMSGAFLLSVSCSLLFYTLDADPMIRMFFYGLMIVIFWTGFSTFYMPYLALGAEFTDDYTERTHLRSYAYGFNIIGMLFGVVLPSMIVEVLISGGLSLEGSWHATGTFVGIVSAISIIITAVLAKDRDHPIQGGERQRVKIDFRKLAEILKDYLDVLKLKPLRILIFASIFYLMANTFYGADRPRLHGWKIP